MPRKRDVSLAVYLVELRSKNIKKSYLITFLCCRRNCRRRKYGSACRKLVLIADYIPINDTSFELSVFWLSDTESRINDLKFSDSVLLSFKTRLTSVTCFYGDVT